VWIVTTLPASVHDRLPTLVARNVNDRFVVCRVSSMSVWVSMLLQRKEKVEMLNTA
jgi:hypothetical protein